MDSLLAHPSGAFRLFPNVKTTAAYFPLHQVIELADIDRPTFENALNPSFRREGIRVIPLLLHEVRHWWDHIGTVWGQARLVSAFTAIHSWLGNDEREFWRILNYHRTVNSDHFAEYYSVIYDSTPPVGGGVRWKWMFSSGMRFTADGRLANDRPIIFTQFRWADNRQACRVPFSVASLLETASMYFENAAEAMLTLNLPEAEHAVEQGLLTQKYLQFLYAPETAVYSVAAHCVANLLHINDIPTAFRHANALSWLCLNLPDGFFSQLRVPQEFEKIWGQRCRSFIDNRDRGFAFLLLAHHMTAPATGEMAEWLERTVVAAGLPQLQELKSAIDKEFEGVLRGVADGPHSDRLKWLLKEGQSVFEAFWPVPEMLAAFRGLGELAIPPILLRDLTLARLGKPVIWTEASTADAWSSTASDLETRFGQFVQACGV